MKGQTTLEFIGSFVFFALVIIGAVTLTIDEVPQFNAYADQTEKNLELKRVTDLLLTSPGQHSNGSGGSDWENHIESVEQPGFASEPLKVERDKIEALDKVGADSYNYTSFRQDLGVEYNYNFQFIWFPVVDMHDNFVRSRPPSNPDIEEPETDFYDRSDNRVHYGEVRLNGEDVRFLNTAYDGDYNTTYVTLNDWDFRGVEPFGEGDVPHSLNESSIGQDFVVGSIQNRDDRPGSGVVLRSDLGEFGRSSLTASGNIEKLSRYPILKGAGSDDEIVRIEVLVW